MNRSKTQMRRVLALHELIKAETFPNCSSFAAQWEVSTKTVQRDVDFLRDQLSAPVEYEALKRGYYYTDPFFMLPSISMSEGELAALVLGSKAMEAYRGTPLAGQLEGVFEKLSTFLPDSVSLNPAELSGHFSFSSPPALPINHHVWETVVEGLVSGRQLKVRHKGKMHTIHPLHLANLQGEWYLFARFYDYDDVCQLAVGRLKEAHLLDKPGNRKKFDVESFTKGVLYRFASNKKPFEVVLAFDKCVADSVIERQWHPDQKVTHLEDGRVELTFTAKGDIELKRWIMAWGQYCEVLSPCWVKEMIRDEVEAMVSNLRKNH